MGVLIPCSGCTIATGALMHGTRRKMRRYGTMDCLLQYERPGTTVVLQNRAERQRTYIAGLRQCNQLSVWARIINATGCTFCYAAIVATGGSGCRCIATTASLDGRGIFPASMAAASSPSGLTATLVPTSSSLPSATSTPPSVHITSFSAHLDERPGCYTSGNSDSNT